MVNEYIKDAIKNGAAAFIINPSDYDESVITDLMVLEDPKVPQGSLLVVKQAMYKDFVNELEKHMPVQAFENAQAIAKRRKESLDAIPVYPHIKQSSVRIVEKGVK